MYGCLGHLTWPGYLELTQLRRLGDIIIRVSVQKASSIIPVFH